MPPNHHFFVMPAPSPHGIAAPYADKAVSVLERCAGGPHFVRGDHAAAQAAAAHHLTVGKEFFGKLLGAMLVIIKSSRKLRCFLLALFVFSLTAAADTGDSHWAGADAEHRGHIADTAGAAGADLAAQPSGERDSNHENHCTMDALCVTGAWTLTGPHAVGLPAMRTSIAGLRPRNLPVKGLRPRPELRPPRHDS